MSKTVFITQDIGVYGSSKSLQLTLKGLIDKEYLKKENIIIIYPKAVKSSLNEKLKEMLRESYFSEFGDSKSWVLPFSHIIYGIHINKLEKTKSFIRILLFYMFWVFKYKKQLKKENIKLIYLNSITLWPMLLVLPKNVRIIMHIREILDLNNPISKVAKKLIIDNCTDLIAIDKKTALPFLKCNKKVFVLRNPFDMEEVKELKINKYKFLCKKYKLDQNKVHISIIGSIQEVKGQIFFCDIAQKNNNNDIFEFIIVGRGNGSYYNAIVDMADKLKNLYYVSEIRNIEEIYAVTHIVIRCDSFFPLGRTVWEAYYSGCKVLLPYNINDDISEIKDYLNKEIFLYKLRDVDSAISKLKEIVNYGFNVDNDLPTSNLEAYIKEVKDILKI